MTYYINEENTGLDNYDQVLYMADSMNFDGHNVEATTNFGAINSNDSPVSDQQWMAYVEQADANA